MKIETFIDNHEDDERILIRFGLTSHDMHYYLREMKVRDKVSVEELEATFEQLDNDEERKQLLLAAIADYRAGIKIVNPPEENVPVGSIPSESTSQSQPHQPTPTVLRVYTPSDNNAYGFHVSLGQDASDVPNSYIQNTLEPQKTQRDIAVGVALIITGGLLFTLGAVAALPTIAVSLPILATAIAGSAVGAILTISGAVQIDVTINAYKKHRGSGESAYLHESSSQSYGSTLASPRSNISAETTDEKDGDPGYDYSYDTEKQNAVYHTNHDDDILDENYDSVPYTIPPDPSVRRNILLGLSLTAVGVTLTTIGVAAILPALALSSALLMSVLAAASVVTAIAGAATLVAGAKLASIGFFSCCSKRDKSEYEPEFGYSMPEIGK